MLDGFLAEVLPSDFDKIKLGDVVRMVSTEDGTDYASTWSDCVVVKIKKENQELKLVRPYIMVGLIIPSSPTIYQSYETFEVGFERFRRNFRWVLGARGKSMNVGTSKVV